MQARKKSGKRPRISVSLDELDYDYIESLGRQGDSLSYTLSRLVREARLSGVILFDERKPTGGIVRELSDWLQSKKKDQFAKQLGSTLDEFLASRD